MEELLHLCDACKQLSITDRWKQLIELYQTIERECLLFQQEYHVHCPTGCGTCCEHFIPHVTDLEASIIAAYLLLIKQDESLLFQTQSDNGSACPLYNPYSPYHCTIYPVRAMICRLFGASPSENKLGELVFRSCKYNDSADSPALLTQEHFASYNGVIHSMQSYGIQFSAIEPHNETTPLVEAIIREMNKLKFMMHCIVSSDSDDDNSGPDIPSPIAS